MLTNEATPNHCERLAGVECSQPYFVPGSLDEAQFAVLRNALILRSCKWDPQVEDVSTLRNFPIVVRQEHWQKLSQWAESLSRELFCAENEIIGNPHLLKELGMPRRLRAVLSRVREASATPTVRTMRFDFHFTTGGWKL